MEQSIKGVLLHCKVCDKFDPKQKPDKTVTPIQDPKPFEVWALNVIGPLPETKKGAWFIITAIDYATRWPVAWATKDHTAQNISKFLGREIISKFGTPKYLVTDGAREFKGNTAEDIYKQHNIIHKTTSPYHPQANGRIKRLNGTLSKTISKLLHNKPKDQWQEQLAQALMVARIRTNRGTGYSPFELTYGYQPNITSQEGQAPSIKIPKGKPPPDTHNRPLKRMRKKAIENSAKRVKQQTKETKQKPYQEGNHVWIITGNPKKMEPKLSGPAHITAVLSGNTYQVTNHKGQSKKYH